MLISSAHLSILRLYTLAVVTAMALCINSDGVHIPNFGLSNILFVLLYLCFHTRVCRQICCLCMASSILTPHAERQNHQYCKTVINVNIFPWALIITIGQLFNIVQNGEKSKVIVCLTTDIVSRTSTYLLAFYICPPCWLI